jgi:3-(3-hydroxy-phenyl)propionate hydroxylase
MKYKPKPRFHRGFLLDAPASRDAKRSLLGKLFPQAAVMNGDGLRYLDDVLGDGFALLAPPGTPPQLLAGLKLAGSGSLPIRAVAVLDKEDASPVETPVMAARDFRGELAKLLVGYPSGLYLLRPDRYVAAFFPAAEPSAAADGVAKLVRQTWSEPTSGSAARSDGRV